MAICIKNCKCLIILSIYFIEPRPEVNKLRPREIKNRNLNPDEPPEAVVAIDFAYKTFATYFFIYVTILKVSKGW